MSKGKCLIADIGGGCNKIGFASDATPHKYHGSSNFITSDLKKVQNLSKLFLNYPFKKGYLNNWDLEKEILDLTLNHRIPNRNLEFDDYEFIITEPYFNFSSAKSTMNQIMFEEYGIDSLVVTNPAFLSSYSYLKKKTNKSCLVIDSGYSFSHLVGMVNGKISPKHVLRLNVGGKIITNRLIEMISYRQLDVRSEVYIMNLCKEHSCFVSNDFYADLERAKSRDFADPAAIAKDYVLPDFSDVMKGYLTQHKQEKDKNQAEKNSNMLFLTNERFTVPELLFYPSDVGFTEMGLEEAIPYFINERTESNMHRLNFLSNVLITGGNAKMPGFNKRLENILISASPDDFTVKIESVKDPQISAWSGGKALAHSPEDYNKYRVKRKEYEEHGDYICETKFPTT